MCPRRRDKKLVMMEKNLSSREKLKQLLRITRIIRGDYRVLMHAMADIHGVTQHYSIAVDASFGCTNANCGRSVDFHQIPIEEYKKTQWLKLTQFVEVENLETGLICTN
ncbi:hypothetical protein KFK09_001241 [Dendrobium nobile]|uniref:Uncharacterized protein n=1 Tax=Dendrobium nobile TaxID=94219 RepID=A0A8T3C927_DENNO|nr:hypothetical protein KFK09_001241 [Dendrobium nobile]